MQVNDLRAFVLTVELGSVTRAAARMNRVQSAVSQALSRLQKEFGVVLLVRGPSGMEPTPAGRELARQGKVILGLIERAERDIAAFGENEHREDDKLTGTVELGIVSLLTPTVLGWLLRAVRARYPRITIRAHENINAETATLVSEGRLHLGLVWLPVRAEGLISHRLGASGLVAVLPADHPCSDMKPLPLARLSDDAWISFPQGNPARRWLEQSCAQVGFAPDVRHEVRTLSEAIAFVESGVGVTLLTRSSISLEGASGRLRVLPLADAPAAVSFGYIATATGRDAVTDAVIALLEEAFGDRAGGPRSELDEKRLRDAGPGRS